MNCCYFTSQFDYEVCIMEIGDIVPLPEMTLLLSIETPTLGVCSTLNTDWACKGVDFSLAT